ncbi:MAG: repeat-containing protein, partial [Verrucomicrobiales bacterium]|nr:repeat-containing protein [Verrucomicrobiales bacterium]
MKWGVEMGEPPTGVPAHEEREKSASPISLLGMKIRYFGDYEILEEIAHGGMGVVYKARQLSLNRLVALKMIRLGQFASPSVIERFHNETEAAARLDHPNIVPIYEVGERDGLHYFSMKLVEGKNLEQAVSGKAFPLRRAAEILVKVAEAVHYAHQRGILHRDLKPANILLDQNGEPYVTDFGLAKLAEKESSLTQSLSMMGTPAYMSPEQAAGGAKQLTVASDVYSLGAILYHLLTGRAPFEGATEVEILRKVLDEEPVEPNRLNPEVDRDLQTVCLKCLQKKPENRYESAQAVGQDLGRWLAEEPISARSVTKPEKLLRWCRRKPMVASLAGLVIVLLLTVLVGTPVAAYRISISRRQFEKERRAVQEKALEARQNLYVADLRLANDAVEADDLGLAAELLNKHIPQAGEEDLRGFEWRWLWKISHGDESNRFSGFGAWTKSVSVSADGNLLAVATTSHQLTFWDLSTRLQVIIPIPCTEVRRGLFSPDGKWFLKSDKERVTVYKLPEWTVLAVMDGTSTFLTISGNGSVVAARCARGVKLWDAITWRELGVIPAKFNPELTLDYGLTVSFDGNLVGIAGPKGKVLVWDIRSWSEIAVFGEGKHPVTCVAIAPDGQTIAAGYESGLVTTWDLTGKVKIADFPGHRSLVSGACFTIDAKHLITVSTDHNIKVWNIAKTNLAGTLRGHEDEIFGLVIAPGNRLLVTAGKDETVRSWDLDTIRGRELVPHSHGGAGTIESTAKSQIADNEWFLVNEAIFPRMPTIALSNTQACPIGIAFSLPKGFPPHVVPMALSSSKQFLAGLTEDYEVRLWDIFAGRLIKCSPTRTNLMGSVAFSPDAKLLAAWGKSSSVQLWLTSTGERVADLRGHKGAV